MSKGLYFGIGFLLGFGAGIAVSSFFVSQTSRVSKPIEQRAADSEFSSKTFVIFQKLIKTGEHEYAGNINGKEYTYRFRPEENKVELYLRLKN